MFGGVAAALAIIFFVTFHELGHFVAAKATGMKATEFFFGFGPRIWSTRKGETEYGLKAIPLGGYVRIIGMNPLEEVAPEDMGRTYREKKFWEKSVVVLAGVGANFLLAFFLFYGLVVSNGVPGDLEPVIAAVTEDSPAARAGLEEGDRITAIDGQPIVEWETVTSIFSEKGPGPVQITIERDGQTMVIDADLAPRPDDEAVGYLGVVANRTRQDIGPLQGIGVAARMIGTGISDTFGALGNMLRPSSLAQFFGVFGGNTDIPLENRPVSPLGIVSIGSQADSVAFFLVVMASINVVLATINLLPFFPLDGGHFAVALYEKLTGRQANMKRLMPIAATVLTLFIFLGLVALILDVVNPIRLG